MDSNHIILSSSINDLPFVTDKKFDVPVATIELKSAPDYILTSDGHLFEKFQLNDTFPTNLTHYYLSDLSRPINHFILVNLTN